MTWKEKIQDLFNTGVFSTVQKLFMVLYYWILGKITTADAQDLCAECGFTFTAPTTTGQTILTNGAATPTVYTIVTLITDYHDNYWPKSLWAPEQVLDMINDIHSAGYITDDEQTTLKGLGW